MEERRRLNGVEAILEESLDAQAPVQMGLKVETCSQPC